MVEVIKRTTISGDIEILLLKAQEEGCPLSFIVRSIVGLGGFEILGVNLGCLGGHVLEMSRNNSWSGEVVEFLTKIVEEKKVGSYS